MTNLRNVVALSATVALVAVGQVAVAQGDLDDLLNDLESDTSAETAKPAETEPAAEEPAAEAPAAEEPAAEPAAAEPEAETAAEPAEEPVAVSEEPAAPAPEKPAEKEEDVLDLLEDLSAEDGAAKPETPAPAEATPAPAEATPAPAAAAAAPEAVVVDPAPAEEPKAEAATPAEPVFTGPDAELRSNIYMTEKLRREAFDLQADREIEEARACMAAEEFQDAAKHYRIAQKLLNDSPKSVNKRKECEQGIAEGLYRAALEEDRIGRRDRAIKLMGKAVDLRHPKARRQLESWLASDDPEANKTDVSDITHRRNETDYKEGRAKTNKRLKRAQQLFATRELDKALDECELVLVAEPFNQEAIRLREKIQRKRHTILMQERRA